MFSQGLGDDSPRCVLKGAGVEENERTGQVVGGKKDSRISAAAASASTTAYGSNIVSESTHGHVRTTRSCSN